MYMHGASAGADYHQWRRMTIRALERGEAKGVIDGNKDTVLHQLATDVEHQLFSLSSAGLLPNARSSLHSILNDAANIHRTLLLQKARYQLHFFHSSIDSPARFEDPRMEAINDIDEMDEDGDTTVDRKFVFCVSPCLEKFGDEFGENVAVRNVLLKAKVCCGVG